MEQEKHMSKTKHFLYLLLTAVLIFAAMCLCYAMGYQFVRSNPAAQNEKTERTEEQAEAVTSHEEEVFDFHEADSETASLSQDDVFVANDPNDYLVIKEGDVVNLYILTKDGEQTFSKELNIAPGALLEEDRAQLENGIILESEEALYALMEDYTS